MSLGAAIIGLVLACAALVARQLDPTNHAVLFVAVLFPYLLPGAVVAAAVFATRRVWPAALLAVVVTVAGAVVSWPRGATPPGDAVTVRVMTANLFEGAADAAAVVDLANRSADLVAFQEMTAEQMDRLTAAGLDREFGHRVAIPRPGSSGTGLWSRYPVVDVSAELHARLQVVPGSAPSALPYNVVPIAARVSLPGAAEPMSVLVVHPPAPWPWPISEWRDSMAVLASAMTAPADSAGCAVVAGDFNATTDLRPFRGLLELGYGDARRGLPTAPTYPANAAVPPLLGIDHVLARGCDAGGAATAVIPGSDHRALLATVLVPA